MQGFIQQHPTVLPILLFVACAAWALSGPAAVALGRGRVVSGLFLFACTGPLAMTLGPSFPLSLDAQWECSTFVRPRRWWGTGWEEAGNLVLLLPVGMLAPLLFRPRRAVAVLLGAAGFPLVIEARQYLLPFLGRQCDFTDVLLNGIGLAVGLTLGVGVAVCRRWSDAHARSVPLGGREATR